MNTMAGAGWGIDKLAIAGLLAMLVFASTEVGAQGFSDPAAFNLEPAQAIEPGWRSPARMGAISRAEQAGPIGPLPVDQAFSMHVARAATGDVLNLVPAQGYLIYRHTLELLDGQGQVIEVLWPHGKAYEDGEFGRVQVFAGPVRLVLPAGKRLAVLHMQGCQANGICYPPMRAVVGADGNTPGWQHAAGGPVNTTSQAQGDLASAMAVVDAPGSDSAQVQETQGGWLAGLLSGPAGLAGFILVGVLMAFSPCLLPMLPVSVSLLAGQPKAGRWALAPVAWFTMAHGAVWALGGFLAAGSGGVLLSAQLQSPGLLAAAAALFLGLGAWQMGWVKIRMPQWAGIRPRWRENGMGPMGAIALGATSALVLGPCAAPLLAGALLAVAQAGDPWMGAVGLGLMGIGMCIPMLAVAAGGSGIMARMRQASPWIAWMGACALWAVAMVLASRILDPAFWPWLATAWAGLAMAGLWSQAAPSGRMRAGLAMALGGVALVGVGSGMTGTLGQGLPAQQASSGRIVMHEVKAGDIDQWVAGNGGQGVVWVVADWCGVCKKFDRQTMSDTRVSGRLGNTQVARVDITAMGKPEMDLLQDLGLVGPPGMLFYRQGEEVPAARLVGFEDADAFIQRLGRAGIEG